MSASSLRLPEESRIGVDVGGTFTDVVVTSRSGDIYTYKLLSTPQDFSEGVIEGIREIIDSHTPDVVAVTERRRDTGRVGSGFGGGGSLHHQPL